MANRHFPLLKVRCRGCSSKKRLIKAVEDTIRAWTATLQAASLVREKPRL